MDVAARESVTEAFARAAQEVGAPRTLIHAAGAADPDYFENLDERRFRTLLETNLTGCWNVLQEGVALIRTEVERPSFILTLSSQAGLIPAFGYTAYGATKFGVHGLTLALRQELYREQIYASVLAPPDVDTPQLLLESATKPPETRRLSRETPLKPEFVARYAVKELYKKRSVIVPGLQTRLECLAYRIAPRLGDRIMQRMIKGVTRGEKDHTR